MMKFKSGAQRTAVILAEQERKGLRPKRLGVAGMLSNRFHPQFGMTQSEMHANKPTGATPLGLPKMARMAFPGPNYKFRGF